jgi:hypothetical protein
MQSDDYRTSRIKEISFPGGRFIDGRIRVDPDTEVVKDEKTGAVVLLRPVGGSGSTIDPCECALETGGACLQVTAEDDDGQIIDIWCEDDGCGFCVGGIRPELGGDFRLELKFARA